MTKLLSEYKTARLLGVNLKTFRIWRLSGRVKPVETKRLYGGVMRYYYDFDKIKKLVDTWRGVDKLH